MNLSRQTSHTEPALKSIITLSQQHFKIQPNQLKMKNLFTPDNAATLMIDHQVGTMKLATSRPAEELIHNACVLARVAVVLDMPLILTSSMETHFQGLILDDIQKIAPIHYERRIK